MPKNSLIDLVDTLLPQTQCGLCGHEAGCLPYAKAMVEHGEVANKCVPGGQPVADALAKLLGRENLPAAQSKWSVDARTGRPHEVRAVIIEDECIGCTKCITACPVDAIVGSGKLMHTVFTDLCTGCELCLPPCPVDCIELVPFDRPLSEAQRQAEQVGLRSRYRAHLARLVKQIGDDANQDPVVSAKQARMTQVVSEANTISKDDAQRAIEAAKLRVQIKRMQKQLNTRPNAKKQTELERLQTELVRLGQV